MARVRYEDDGTIVEQGMPVGHSGYQWVDQPVQAEQLADPLPVAEPVAEPAADISGTASEAGPSGATRASPRHTAASAENEGGDSVLPAKRARKAPKKRA